MAARDSQRRFINLKPSFSVIFSIALWLGACGDDRPSLKAEVDRTALQSAYTKMTPDSVLGYWRNKGQPESLEYLKIENDRMVGLLWCGSETQEFEASFRPLLNHDEGYFVVTSRGIVGDRLQCDFSLWHGEIVPFSVVDFEARFRWPLKDPESDKVFVKISDLP